MNRARRVLASLLLGLLVLGTGADIARGDDSSATSEQVSFSNGAVKLSGTLYLPAGNERHAALVVFHAANGGTRDFHAYRHLTTALPAAGIAVLVFDRRGSGASTGDFTTATFKDLAGDGLAGIALLKKRRDIDPLRIGVWGVSQGGWLAPLAATLSRDVAFVVSVSVPGGRPPKQTDYDPLITLTKVRVPMAFFFAPTDAWVPVQESIVAIRRATFADPSVKIREIQTADHLMETGTPDSGGPTSEQYLKELLGWLREQTAPAAR